MLLLGENVVVDGNSLTVTLVASALTLGNWNVLHISGGLAGAIHTALVTNTVAVVSVSVDDTHFSTSSFFFSLNVLSCVYSIRQVTDIRNLLGLQVLTDGTAELLAVTALSGTTEEPNVLTVKLGAATVGAFGRGDAFGTLQANSHFNS